MSSSRHVIVVAGGKGLRMETDIPKQFIPIGGKPVLMRTIQAFADFDSQIHIVLVLTENFLDYWRKLCNDYNFRIPHEIVTGGQTRFDSVKNGLERVSGGYVAVHDAARPFVSQQLITECFRNAEESLAVIPVVPMTDSCRMLNEDGRNFIVDRSLMRMVQTPQVFQTSLLQQAYKTPFQEVFTDDASVVEAFHPISLVPGENTNIKITNPIDLSIAEWIIEHQHS